jgi:GAF domain-containing protein
MTTSVLCVDGDRTERDRTVAALSTASTVTTTRGSLEAAEDALRSATFDCLVTEYALPDGTGLELVAAARRIHPDIGCVLFTDTPFAEIDTSSLENVVVDHLSKTSEADYDFLPDLVESVAAERTHTAYPLPPDEDDRLAALESYDVGELRAAETFDRLTELASRQFDARFAFVGLVDSHEERFVSCYGADWKTIPREKTVCTYAILEDDVMVVEDTVEDPRFNGNDILRDLEIRSYAGAQLRGPSAEPLGMFCVLDDEPRQYDADERDALRLFAAEASEQLELRRRLSTSRAMASERMEAGR